MTGQEVTTKAAAEILAYSRVVVTHASQCNAMCPSCGAELATSEVQRHAERCSHLRADVQGT